MANGINYELDFEKRISEMPDRQLLEFVARQAFDTNSRCTNHTSRLITLESGDKRQSGIVGGISGAITGVIIGVINYFTVKGQ